MSSSSADASLFSVESEPGVRITIYNAAGVELRRAERAVALPLTSGLYRVELERTGRIETHVAIHRNTTALHVAGPAFETPTLIREAASSHDYYTNAAVELSTRDTCRAIGPPPHTSKLFVFVRRHASPDRALRVPSEPITIHDVAGHLITTLCPVTSRVDAATGYIAFSGLVAPGSYRVRANRSRRDVAISIPAHRAAHLFVADADVVRLDDLRVSIVPAGTAFDPASPIAAAMEHVLAALRSNTRDIPDHVRALWPDAAEADLAFGIASAHLLRRAGDAATFDAVMARLMSYVDALPDVAILDRARGVLADPARRLVLSAPPLMRASVVLAAELDSPSIVVEQYSAFERAARTAYRDSVWCTWSDRPWDGRWIAPTIDSLRARGGRSAAAIARTIALPLHTVERAIDRLDATLPSLHGVPIPIDAVKVPGYVVGELVGRGSQGAVFRATREQDGRPVALKVLPWLSDAEVRRRAVLEIEIMKRFRHPRILHLEDHGELPDGGGLWLELELCAGSVEDALADRVSPLPMDRACWIVRQALDGLAYIHDTRTVHCDLKPGNLLLRADGSVAIADFGIAKQLGRAGRVTGAPVGTARFAAPEQLSASGHASPAADVWSMAATLYFMLTLELPRDEYAGQDEIAAALDNSPVPLAQRWPEAPAPLAACIDRALSTDPRKRPANAGMLRDELLAALDATAQAAGARAQATGTAAAPASIGVRRALVIGVQIGSVSGTEHDAGCMRAMLESRGFEVDFRIGSDATRARILEGYDRLIASTEPGDTVVTYYSGSGLCMTLGHERWCLIAPSDARDGEPGDWRGITTWELSLKEAELTRKTRNVSVVMDCCFLPVTSRDSEANQANPKADAMSSFTRGFPAHLEALRVKYGTPMSEDQRVYNPDVVRLLASVPEGTAYEYRGDDGQTRGAFTEALLDVLAGIGDRAVSWRVIAELVRSRVSCRFLTQRPVVEGPAARVPFSLVEHGDSDALPIDLSGDALVIGGGSLTTGLLNRITVGDIYAALPNAHARFERATSLGELEITEVGTVASRARWLFRRTALPSGAVAVPIVKHAARTPLALAVPDDERSFVLQAVYASAILRVAEPSDASPVATLRVEADAVSIEDSWGRLSTPRPFPGGLDAMVSRAATLAIARQLRELEGEHGVFEDEFQVELGIVGQSSSLSLHGATVRFDDRLSIRVTSATHRTLFAHVLGVNARGDIALLSRDLSTELEPGAPGFVADEVSVEHRLAWPDDLPRDYVRPEEIVVVVSTELTDLSGLETPVDLAEPTGLPSLPPSAELRGMVPAAGSKLDLLAQLRDRGIRNLEAGEREWPFCVKRITYLLAPDEPRGDVTYSEALVTPPIALGADLQGEATP